jgi:hypothetical protein
LKVLSVTIHSINIFQLKCKSKKLLLAFSNNKNDNLIILQNNNSNMLALGFLVFSQAKGLLYPFCSNWEGWESYVGASKKIFFLPLY